MKNTPPRLWIAYTGALPISFYAAGFLGNFYVSTSGMFIVAAFCHIAASLYVYLGLGKAAQLLKTDRAAFSLALILTSALIVFPPAMFMLAKQHPDIFSAAYILMEAKQYAPYIAGVLASLPACAWLFSLVRNKEFNKTPLFNFISDHYAGISIGLFFFAGYFILATAFNNPILDSDDIFFDADSRLWRRRFTSENWVDYYWRGVHPYVLIIVRPFAFIISLFIKRDTLSAGYILVALTGAFSIYLVWRFIKKINGSDMYAALIAALFGATTSHFVFSVVMETYIFLAAIALIFLCLLLENRPFYTLVIAGLAAFGITISNIAYAGIAFFFVKRDLKAAIKYGLIVAALTFPLAFLNEFIYPNSNPAFYDPKGYGAEDRNTFTPTLSRAIGVSRVIAMQSIIAPDPMVLPREHPFLKIFIFESDRKVYGSANPMRVTEYETVFGSLLAWIWTALVILGFFLQLKNIRKDDLRFPLALFFILLFNFALHMRYGREIFLYSTNYTYAVVLILALAWKDLSRHIWFQSILLTFIALLLINNTRLIVTMLNVSSILIN